MYIMYHMIPHGTNCMEFFKLSSIKETVAFYTAQLNMLRTCRIFYLDWELSFLLFPTDREPQGQVALPGKWSRGAGVRAGAKSQGPQCQAKPVELVATRSARSPEQVHRDETGLRSDQDGTSSSQFCGWHLPT